jgi:DNA-binding MarR family transcriptional regulator
MADHRLTFVMAESPELCRFMCSYIFIVVKDRSYGWAGMMLPIRQFWCIYMFMDFAGAARAISEQCLCTRVRQVARAVTKIYDDGLRSLGLQSSQLTVLVAVARFGENGARMNSLADVLVMDRTTLSRNLRPLERLGLLRVARSPDDARARIVLLTRAGERAIEKGYPLWERAQREVRALIGASEAEQLQGRAAGVLRALAGDGPAASGRRGRRP